MHEDKKNLLVDALKSGRFKQTQHALNLSCLGPNRMCCLGVGCEVFRCATGQGEWVEDKADPGRMRFVIDEDDSSNAYMPKAVQEWFGMASKDGAGVLENPLDEKVIEEQWKVI